MDYFHKIPVILRNGLQCESHRTSQCYCLSRDIDAVCWVWKILCAL